MTAKIIKFPEHPYCADCNKTLQPGEGTPCKTEGCEKVGCDTCTEASEHCLEHIGG